MQCPPETQSCIRRALQWIALGSPKMNIASLCEAVSFQEDMDVFEADDIIEPEVISRNCGCLLRKSLDGNYFEFAHFTVLEYLERTEVGDFRYSEADAYQSFAQASIGFILLPHFDRVPTIIDTVEEAYAKERNQKHPFYKFAAHTPLGIQRSTGSYPLHLKILEEEPVLNLLKRLFDIHKTGNFRAWAHAVLSGGQNELWTMHQLSNGPLQFAVFLLSPKLCQFLIDSGVDVNVVRDNYTPLAMAIGLEESEFLDEKLLDPVFIERVTRTIKVLLDNGADTAFVVEGKSCMAHAIESLEGHHLLQFIRPTSTVPEDAVTAFSNFEWKNESDDLVLEAILRLAVGEKACPQWKPLAATALSFSRGRGLSIQNRSVDPMAYSYNDLEYRQALDIASKFGLVEELSILISDSRFGGVIAKPTDFELLSAAARSTSANSGRIVELFLGSGIDGFLCSTSGQNCLHISCESNNAEVASVLLSRGVDPGSRDEKGQNSWHAACYNGHEKIITLLQKEDKNTLENLATIDEDGRTPFSATLHNGHMKPALALLEILPAEAKYFMSKSPIMHDAVVTGSLELLTALRDKGVTNFGSSNSESTPMHHLSAACTPEFARSLAELFDPFCADNSGKFPFQLFFQRWLAHNMPLKLDKTIPLDSEILKILIPKDQEFSNSGKVTHAWELLCGTLELEDICCEAGTFVAGECYYYFSRDLTTLFNHGILSSFEGTRNRSAVVPLIGSLKGWIKDHFCSTSIVTLLSQVMDSSKVSISLQAVDDSYHLFKLAMLRASPEVAVKLISLGVDVHRRVPDRMSESPMSLFEMACGEANIEIFKAILEAIPSQTINHVGPTGQSPLELVVKGSSLDKTSLIEALDEKGLTHLSTSPATPLIIEAAKQNDLDLVKCLSDIGHDSFAVDFHGWGVPQWATTNRQLDMLKWIVNMSASPSQWQLSPKATWSSTYGAKTKKQILDDEVSLLHFAADVPDFLSYFFDNHFFDINISTSYGRTVLHYAAMRGSMACCLMLIDQGINISAQDKDGKLAIDYALETGFDGLASLLLSLGSPLPRGQVAATGDMIKGLISNEGLELARRRDFEDAIMKGNLEQCKLAVSQGCLIDKPLPSCHSCTPIFAAIRAQKDAIVNWLLDEGASTNSSFCKHHSTQNLFSYAVTTMDSAPFIEKLLSAALESQSITRVQLIHAICHAIYKNTLNVLKLMLNHFRKNSNDY
jgi:ankyrin repeat protein